jgi:TrkA-C domain
MDNIELVAQKRAFPSRGRARIHVNDLSKLEIQEGSTIEISIPGTDTWISATAFADSLVEPGHIRLSDDDLKAVGAGEGAMLRIRKKSAMTDQIRSTFQGAASTVAGEVGKAGESLKSASPDSIRAGAAGAAVEVGDVLGKAGGSISSAVTQAVEAAKKKLKPADAVTLDKALKANKGEVRAVTVHSGTGMRPLSAIKLPKGVVLAAVQRGNAIQTTDPSLVLVSNDIVYLVGESSLLDEAARMIGG